MKDNKDDKLDNKKRKIEFRVKDRTKNKWYYGCPIMYNDGSFSFYDTELIEKCDHCLDAYPYSDVDENTLGQFTGLCDKSGKKIYEGDIVKLEKGFWGGTYNYVLIEENENYAVYYDECGRFDLKTEDKNLQFKSVAWHQLVEGNVEVVGNIYDNPELLGGSDEECDN